MESEALSAPQPPPPTARYAVTLSITEVAVGSIVHAVHLPLGGHFLSLNQILILTWATRSATTRRKAVLIPTLVSNSAAVLKALSPAGKRLTPMLAISMQGWLYAIGVGILGANRAGASLGAGISSAWGFAQPLVLAYFIFGKPLFAGIEKIWSELAALLPILEGMGMTLIWSLVATKAIFAATLAGAAWGFGAETEARYLGRLEHWSRRSAPRLKRREPATPPLRGALRDLAQPWMLAATMISLGLFLAGARPGIVEIALHLLRIIALALLLFWGVRAVPRSWVERILQRFPTLNKVVDQVIASLSRT